MKTTMIKSLLLVVALSVTACNGNSRKDSNDGTNQTEEEEIREDSYAAKKAGYKRGYEDGYNDGYGWLQRGINYYDKNNFQTDDAISAYKSGYKDGYDTGYNEGEKKKIDENEKEKLRDWHNWEDEDVDGLYIYMEGVKDDEEAYYIAKERYEGEYIREGWKYFAKIDYTWGNYEITLGERISSNLYNIRGCEIYIHFKWGLPDVSSNDEGVLDWSGTFSSFYKKPDDL